MLDLEQVKRDAEEEFAQEQHRLAVEREKERLRRNARFWIKIFPWRIRVVKLLVPFATHVEKKAHYISELKKLGYKRIGLESDMFRSWE